MQNELSNFQGPIKGIEKGRQQSHIVKNQLTLDTKGYRTPLLEALNYMNPTIKGSL